MTLTVVWQAQGTLTTDYTAFAHLVDEGGQGWAGDDHQPFDGTYPTSAWGAGEMVRDSFTLTVPADAPPGLYNLEVGWYDPATGQRLPVGDGDTVRVAVLPAGWEAAVEENLAPLGASFGEKVTLEGYAWQVDPSAVQVTLRWSAESYLDTDYTVFLHLVAPDGKEQVVAQGDGPPLGGRWPTSLWPPGLVLNDVHTIPRPTDLAPGSYHLLLGLYDPATGERLSLPDGDDAVRLEINLP